MDERSKRGDAGAKAPTGPAPSPLRAANDGAAATRAAESPASAQSAPSDASHVSRHSETFQVVSAPSPSLPKGGGAVRSIGEKFTANPATGTASLSIPIPPSPARHGLQPELALQYDSGSGNGPFGVGFGVHLPAVTRKTDKGLPRYHDADESDVFILAGAEDLVPSLAPHGANGWSAGARESGQFHIQCYRPRVEGSFVRIERWLNTATNDAHFRATTKDNVTSVFGESAGARIFDPADASRVFSWLLERTYDDRGNVVAYEYAFENSDGVTGLSEQNRSHYNRYVKRILYGNRTAYTPGGTLAIAGADWMFEVLFDYGERGVPAPGVAPTYSPAANATWLARQDSFSSYRAGFEIRTHRLCRRIMAFHRFSQNAANPNAANAFDPVLVHATEFLYDEDPALTKLREVHQVGYRPGQSERRVPALLLSYVPATPDHVLRELDATSSRNLPEGIDGTRFQWVDLDGEGISGVLSEQAGAWFYKRNLGGGDLGPVEVVTPAPAMRDLGGGTQLMDLAGDGRKYLVRLEGPVAGYQARTEDGGWTPFRPFRTLPNVAAHDPNLRLLDLDGDGLADMLLTEDEALRLHPSLGKDGFGPAQRRARPRDEERGPALVFADGTDSIYLADMSGDGLTDLVRIRNGQVCYWPNLGYGNFGAKVTMELSPRFASAEAFRQDRIRLGDVDGSGTTDILYLGNDGVRYWINETGNRFAQAVRLNSVPPVDSLTNVALVDLLGTGTSCLVLSTRSPVSSRARIRYIDLMSGKKPHLLERIDNQMGRTVDIEYIASTAFYLADKKAGHPWVTRLPFPVQCVSKVKTTDLVQSTGVLDAQSHPIPSTLVTRYAYHHGFYDGQEREFRGFGMVEQRDAEDFGVLLGQGSFPHGAQPAQDLYVPPVLTKTWFHTGAFPPDHVVSRQFGDEYFVDSVGDLDLGDSVLASAIVTTPEQREALRTLRGKPLRQEIYADDPNDPLSVRPYQVTENNYRVERLQPIGNRRHGVFFAHAGETLTCHYERTASDPRVAHQMVLAVSSYGDVTDEVSIVYPRRSGGSRTATQALRLMTYSKHEFVDEGRLTTRYRVGVPWHHRTWEFTNVHNAASVSGLYTPSEVSDVIANQLPGEIAFEVTPSNTQLSQRLIAEEVTRFYDDNLTSPRAVGAQTLSPQGLSYESYRLAFTSGLISAHYGTSVDATMLGASGYIDLLATGDWWARSGRPLFTNAGANFYQPTAYCDAFDNVTTVQYDADHLLIARTTDPIGNATQIDSDYVALAPYQVTDANGNGSFVVFDPLGQVTKLIVFGKGTGTVNGVNYQEGDTLSSPTAEFSYALDAWSTSGSPNYAYAKAKNQHRDRTDASGNHHPTLDADTTYRETYTYVDGFGRTILTKSTCADGPHPIPNQNGSGFTWSASGTRWLASGRVVYDNKGNPKKQYEPYFSGTPGYEDAAAFAHYGVTQILRHDPLGRLVQSDLPDGTVALTQFSPWDQTVFDGNDTSDGSYGSTWKDRSGGDTRATALAQENAGTPDVVRLDTLGRVYETLKSLKANNATTAVVTRTALDIQGNARHVYDARAIQTNATTPTSILDQDFDLLGRVIHAVSQDAGETWSFVDAGDQTVWSKSARADVTVTSYDARRRPVASTVHPANGDLAFVSEAFVYRDGGSNDPGYSENQHGRPYQQKDQAGVVTFTYDFKGNVLSQTRELYVHFGHATAADAAAVQAFAVEMRVADWAASPNYGAPQSLGFAPLAALTDYDAFNRPIVQTLPSRDPTLAQNQQPPPPNVVAHTYDKGGELFSITVTPQRGAATTYVSAIEYNEKRQRTKIVFGTDSATYGATTTTYAYDPLTFRLTSLVTKRAKKAGGPDKLQDLSYIYDAVGNIVEITDSSQDTLYFNNAAVDPTTQYWYDTLYRLVRADGREHVTGGGLAPRPELTDKPGRFGSLVNVLPDDGAAVQAYSQRYTYDLVGNFSEMKQLSGGQTAWAREYTYIAGSNRLATTTDAGGQNVVNYTHDSAGNMTVISGALGMDWDERNQLSHASKGSGDTTETYFVYDAGGERVRKRVYTQVQGMTTLASERFYVGQYEFYREYDANGAASLERETVHVMDDQRRIAVVEQQTVGANNASQVVRYQFDNHLGTACIEADDGANLISYEEYHPYGTTSYRAATGAAETSLKRYRYTGKERDEETGLSYHGVRYLGAWLGRWVSADPAGMVDGTNLFVAFRNEPVRRSDPDGRKSIPDLGVSESPPPPSIKPPSDASGKSAPPDLGAPDAPDASASTGSHSAPSDMAHPKGRAVDDDIVADFLNTLHNPSKPKVFPRIPDHPTRKDVEAAVRQAEKSDAPEDYQYAIRVGTAHLGLDYEARFFPGQTMEGSTLKEHDSAVGRSAFYFGLEGYYQKKGIKAGDANEIGRGPFKNISTGWFLDTLFHEGVHSKQFHEKREKSEVEAYQLDLAHANEFRLSSAEIKEIKRRLVAAQKDERVIR